MNKLKKTEEAIRDGFFGNSFQIREKLEKLPFGPGVYLMKDVDGNVIYIGKAGCLAKRVKSYFTKAPVLKNIILTSCISDLDIIPVYSEEEALVLENKLIKKFQPKYNVNLKDGKSYPFLKITREMFPSMKIVREEKTDGAFYFGPFTDVKMLRKLVQLLRRYFLLRNCSKDISDSKELFQNKACIEYHIGRCSAPCAGKISKRDYQRTSGQIVSFLQGNHKRLQTNIRKQMIKAIKILDFEEAQRMKERLFVIQSLKEKLTLRDESELVTFGRKNVLAELSKALNLPKIPNLIEGYDISNLGGEMATGSKVSFKGGIPWKGGYRKFRIKSVAGINDCGMLKEVLHRRFDDKKKRTGNIPELILIDGGKGQLQTAVTTLKQNKLNIAVIALAKQREEIYLPDRTGPLILPDDSPVLHLLQRIRNEAHRFAITYHKSLRIKKVHFSYLDEIPGIGTIRKQRIISNFQDAYSLAAAKQEDLVSIGITKQLSTKVIHKTRQVLQETAL